MATDAISAVLDVLVRGVSALAARS